MTIKLAKIIRSARREFSCLELNPDQTITRPFKSIEAKALGLLLKDGDLVAGDTVEVELNKDEWFITKLLPRQNYIFRTSQRESKNKILASNVDYLILVFSMERPEFKRGLLDRYLLRSVQWGIPAIIILNKCDLRSTDHTNHPVDWEFEYERVKTLCHSFYSLSALSQDQPSNLPFAKNYKDLEKFLDSKTVIFMGQSGVGKSKLIQTLSNFEIKTKSLELGVVGKGVHTTSWTELHVLQKFNLIDSPGIRSLSLNDLTQNDLLDLMPDLAELAQKCQFHNCQHEEKSKGCYFWSDKKNALVESRFQSYLRFKEEIQSGKLWEKEEY